MTRALPLLLLFASGCAGNAILEVELDLPEPSGDVQYAVVQGRSGMIDFEDEWAGGGIADGLELGSGTVVVGIEADDAGEITAPLSIRIRYCRDPACADPQDGAAQEVRVTVERAFYAGEFTQIQAEVLELPAVADCTGGCAPTTFDLMKCDVKGCRDGETNNWCSSDGKHFCEQ